MKFIIIIACLIVLLTSRATLAEPGKKYLKEPIPPPGFDVLSVRSDSNRPVRPNLKSYHGPIIDTHIHLNPSSHRPSPANLQEIADVITSVGVELAIVMPTPNEGLTKGNESGFKEKLRLSEKSHNKVKLFCGGEYITTWLNNSYRNGFSESQYSNVLSKLTSDLNSTECRGIGEIAFFHFEKYTGQRVINYPPNFEPFLKIVNQVAISGRWFDLHSEPMERNGTSHETEAFGGLELILKNNPNLKLIYSHTAMTNAHNVEAILKRYPNVMINIKMMGDKAEWTNLEEVTNDNHELFEDWAQLFEQYPSRFTIGSDAKFGGHGDHKFSMSKYEKLIRRFRKVLGSLDPEVASQIAYANALKMFGD